MNVLGMIHSIILLTYDSQDGKAKYRPTNFSGIVGLVFLVLGLVLATSAMAGQNEGPQELPKPAFKTTPPLFQDWNFDKDQDGAMPSGFLSNSNNGGGEGKWVVTKGDIAFSKPQVVVHNAKCADVSCYNILLGEKTEVAYVDISVQMRLMLADPSSRGGIVLGAQDHQNFYAILVTPSTNIVEAFLVRDGKPTSLGTSKITPVAGDWHFLRVQRNPMISHDLLNVFFDQQMLLSLSDSTFKRGKVGLVTWGKGAFAFDDFRAVENMTNLPLSRPPAY